MGWYDMIKDCRYCCCSSKIKLMKGKFFFGQFQAFWRSLRNWGICLCCRNTIYFSFQKVFLWWISHFFQFFFNFSSFHLVYLLKAHMKFNGQKWLDEMEQTDSEKNFWYCMTNRFFYLLTFNFRVDIMTIYTFNQIRCFFYI